MRAIEHTNKLKQQRIIKEQQDRIEEVKKRERAELLADKAAGDLVLSRLMLDKEDKQRK